MWYAYLAYRTTRMNVVVTTMVAAAKGSKRNNGFLIQKHQMMLKN